MIDRFEGEDHYLSNFHNSPMEYNGLKFLNAESAFQSQKATDPMVMNQFVDLPPNKAKALGRKVVLRDDWEKVKDQVMYEVVKNKFTQNPDLGRKLKETGDAFLEEGNSWNDTYWGICSYTGEGDNKLGEILMRVRGEI